ncbi:MAG: hypothetical protein ABUS56_10640 [Acidobacteriota bacterium]
MTKRRSVAHWWGSTEAERVATYPCDAFLPDADHALFRCVDINAPAPVVFRWLCQLRAAPYSYDWIDNGGRPSPRTLTPGLEHLDRGQTVMSIFALVDFEPDRQMTVVIRKQAAVRAFGQVAGSYVVAPVADHACRLVVKLLARYPHTLYGAFLRALLPWGDVVMMRKQLLTLKRLAETSRS